MGCLNAPDQAQNHGYYGYHQQDVDDTANLIRKAQETDQPNDNQDYSYNIQ
jgi:hypothetical protein